MFNRQGGAVTIIISVIILITILLTAVVITNVVFLSNEAERLSYFSYNSYYAAESGLEYVLYHSRSDIDPNFLTTPANFPVVGIVGGASYTVTVDSINPTIIIRSTGEYQGTKRTITIYWE